MATSDVIGFLGLGAMGVPMVERLLDGERSVVVWNRTPERCAAVVARGAQLAATPAEVMRRCDVVAICLADGAAVEGVAYGADGLLSATTPRARVVLDCSTIDPDTAIALSARAADAGIAWLDCPVSGGVPAARAGRLIGFAGGSADDLQRAHALTDALFSKVTLMGGPGSGQLAKLINQWIVASNVLVMGEALAAATAMGLDAAKLPAALAGGFADSQPLQIFGPRMVSHTYEPKLGAIRLMRKDANLALKHGTAHGATLPMLSNTVATYERIAQHPEMSLEDDISSLIRLFEAEE